MAVTYINEFCMGLYENSGPSHTYIFFFEQARTVKCYSSKLISCNGRARL